VDTQAWGSVLRDDFTVVQKVVKPLEFVTKGRKDLVQPAMKVRGLEYLRIIYGPEYTLPENLQRLKSRGLGAKRASPCESSL
jgi:hypothetical protein